MSEKRERGHYALVPAREAGWLVLMFEYGGVMRQDDILCAGSLSECLLFIRNREEPTQPAWGKSLYEMVRQKQAELREAPGAVAELLAKEELRKDALKVGDTCFVVGDDRLWTIEMIDPAEITGRPYHLCSGGEGLRARRDDIAAAVVPDHRVNQGVDSIVGGNVGDPGPVGDADRF
jgi:hypothetical protein